MAKKENGKEKKEDKVCKECSGSGWKDPGEVICPECKGAGR